MRGYRRTAVAAALVLVAAELFLRVVPVGRIERQVWPTFEYQRKDADMTSRAITDENGVVYVGSSVVDAGIDPVVVDASNRSTIRSYNAALLGGSAQIVDSWTRNFVVPRLHPRMVVLGVSSRDVNAHNSELANAERAYDDAPAVRELLHKESISDVIERKASDWSYVVRYREELRQPVSAVRGVTPPDLFADSIPGPQGFERSFVGHDYTIPKDRITSLRTKILTDFDTNGSEMDAIGSLVRWLTDQHIKVLVLNVPVTQDYVSAHPHGQADYARYQEKLASVAMTSGAAFVDPGIWDTTFFAEPLHLNGVGAERLSRFVAQQVADLTSS
jgi:hypothetical protein